MRILTCPHCGKPGISMMRELALGPARPATCRSCKRKVGVPWWSLLSGVPFVGALIVFAIADNTQLGVAALLLGGAAMFVIHARYVPLEKREPVSDPALLLTDAGDVGSSVGTLCARCIFW